MTTMTVRTPAQAVEQAIRLCLNQGQLVHPRGLACYEVTNATLIVDQPWHVPFELTGRGLRPFIGAVEALQLVGQTSNPETVAAGSPPMSAFTDGGVFHGAYGIRVHGRLLPLVEQLTKDPDSRQAVLSVYDAGTDLGRDVTDVPCTLTLQYLIRDGQLCARTSMRSNDVWLGLPYDLTQFIALQGAIAAALRLPLGWYSHTVGSLHVYQRNVAAAVTVDAPEEPWCKQEPLWADSSIGDISRTARRILTGAFGSGLTPFEAWLVDAVGTGQR